MTFTRTASKDVVAVVTVHCGVFGVSFTEPVGFRRYIFFAWFGPIRNDAAHPPFVFHNQLFRFDDFVARRTNDILLPFSWRCFPLQQWPQARARSVAHLVKNACIGSSEQALSPRVCDNSTLFRDAVPHISGYTNRAFLLFLLFELDQISAPPPQLAKPTHSPPPPT